MSDDNLDEQSNLIQPIDSTTNPTPDSIPIGDLNLTDSSEQKAKRKVKKKSVGFAPLPEEDLKEHHEAVHKKEQEKLKSNPFHKIPPELQYLEKKKSPNPKPISTTIPKPPKPIPLVTSPNPINSPPTAPTTFSGLGRLQSLPIKDISLQNKQTELNFNYPSIDLPIPPTGLLVKIIYTSLNSYDLNKINQYLLNVSNVKVGLGYEYVGEVQEIGSTLKASGEFFIGDKVLGMIDPTNKKGTLSTSLLINPDRDVVIRITNEMLSQLQDVDIELSFSNGSRPRVASNDNFEIESSSSSSTASLIDETISNKQSDIPSLAKLTTFPVLYSKSRQILSHSKFNYDSPVNILINGADTNIGFTLIQTLLSTTSSYKFTNLNLILLVKKVNEKSFKSLINNFKQKYFNLDPIRILKFTIITFEAYNLDDLILKNEKVPIVYREVNDVINEVLNGLKNPDIPFDNEDINKFKLDLFVDIVGSKRYFQTNHYKSNNPHFQVPKSTSFLQLILKPKIQGSVVISCCNFYAPVPTYEISSITNTTSDANAGSSASYVWSNKWSANLLNNWTSYNYFEEIDLKLKRIWIEEGLELLLKDQLKFKIDDNCLDWRIGFKNYIKLLKSNDMKFIFKIEEF
ncbi:hypothetical protein DFJ63DRAFT_312719 [Scheffersomyces coipomensis]|uniref:uncharacterized protein n=1 Tax=Scheffersomyces coipomensis TaxID=1788519 RepID=UPI00315D390A